MEFRLSESDINDSHRIPSEIIDKLSTASVIIDSINRDVADALNITLPNSGHDLSGKAQCGKSEYT